MCVCVCARVYVFEGIVFASSKGRFQRRPERQPSGFVFQPPVTVKRVFIQVAVPSKTTSVLSTTVHTAPI